MALTPTISDELKLKVNVNIVVNRNQEATAEDFAEIAAHIQWIFDWIAAQTGTTATRSSVGVYTSITQLTTAIPVGNPTDYAIIEEIPGASLQIVKWNDIAEQWEYESQKEQFVYIANYEARPNPGEENTFYITLDNFNYYVFKNGDYQLLNKPAGIYTINDGAGHPWSVVKDPQNNDPDTNSIQLYDRVFGYTDNTYVRYLDCTVINVNFNKDDAST